MTIATKPVEIYDIALDALRPVRQSDIANLGELTKSWGKLVDASRDGKTTGTKLRQIIAFERRRLMEVWKSE